MNIIHACIIIMVQVSRPIRLMCNELGGGGFGRENLQLGSEGGGRSPSVEQSGWGTKKPPIVHARIMIIANAWTKIIIHAHTMIIQYTLWTTCRWIIQYTLWTTELWLLDFNKEVTSNVFQNNHLKAWALYQM